MTSIENLQELFMKENKPYWRIYSGQGVRGAKRAENTTISDMEASCEELVERLQILGEGVYTVVLLPDPNCNNSKGPQHFVKMNGPGSIGSTDTPAGGAFQGASFMQMLEFARMLNNQGAENIEGVVTAAVEDVRKDFEIQRLQDRVKELEAGGARDRLIEGLVRKAPDILDRFFPAGAGGGRHPQKPMAGILGTAGIPTTGDTPAVAIGEDEDEEIRFSIDDAVNACLEIQEALPGENVNQLLWKLANYIKANPDQAKGLLNML